MHRAAARRHNYHRSHRHHRQQDGDRSSDEDSSNSGSSEEESISPSSSASISSSTSAEGEESESDREEFVQEVLSFSDSEESSEEECVEDNILSPSSSSGSESDEDSDVIMYYEGGARSTKKKEDDSDLSSSSSFSEDSESDDDYSKEIQTGTTIKNNIKSHSRFVFNGQGQHTLDSEGEGQRPSSILPSAMPKNIDSNTPLSPWTNSHSKRCIIEALKDSQSSIHSLAPTWEENIDELWKQYAHRYQRSKFKGYMKTIMNNYNARKGPFKVESDQSFSSLWEDSSSRKRIIEDLRDCNSPIHKLVQDWEKNLDSLWKEYAPQYQRSKFKGYMATLMTNFRAKKGPFKDTWNSKKNGNHSKGYSLLHLLMMKKDIGDMSVAEVHASHPLFAVHPFKDFKRYYSNMKAITDKSKSRLENYSEMLGKHFASWSRAGPKTSRGEYFWDAHPASSLLEKDVKDGRVKGMSPKDIWASRDEYKEFEKSVFRKHVYQEVSKQKGGVYWQVKRNRKGQKSHDKEVRRLRKEFMGNIDDEVNDLASDLAKRWRGLKDK